ncbi:GroES-like protein [Sistotremastrum suecicum HHB10207 ss-3]|uniref:GroES-like protein n=1 Tax=Sistotremastrum suecicum HHB10207 ss-3 TaxID=1314776 RepID=A0A166C6C0_9AGAM|nr:GroES-like protein [Sistotremastrum suecicum HHB10207 ss-3]
MTTSIPTRMKGVYLPGDRKCEIRDVEVPTPQYGQVLVEMRASTICGSDLRAIYRPKIHKTGAEGYNGVIAGHEPCGLIVKRGPGVNDKWKEGTRVIVYHIQGCGFCHPCRRGEYISCTGEDRKAYGWQRDGGHGEYIVVDQQSLVILEEPLTYLDGAMIACGIGTSYAACARASVSGKDIVLVTGLGPVGLGTALIATRLGARVIGLEFDQDRVDFARSLGIESIACSGNDADDVSTIVKIAGGEGVDVSIDCSGNSSARLTCMKSTRAWGRVVFVGEGGQVTFDVSELVIHKSLAIFGSWVCSISQMEELVEKLVRWDLHPEVAITHTFTIEDAARAYELFDAGKTGKCAITYKGERKQYVHNVDK